MNIYESNPSREVVVAQLSELADVELTDLSNNQTLVWDAENEVWVNANNAGTPTPQGLGFGYGSCSTEASTVAKEVSISGFTLVQNGYVSIKFVNDVPSNATLNISSTGAKPIYYGGQAISANVISGGDVATFVYDGTNYVLVAIDHTGGGGGSIDTLSDTLISNVQNNQVLTWDSTANKWVNKESAASPESIGIGYGTCSTASSTSAKVVTLSGYELVKNGIVSVMFSNAITGACTLNINNKGAKSVYYRGVALTDGVIGAMDTATFIYDGTNYNLISIDKANSARLLQQTLSVGSTYVTFTNVPTTGTNTIDIYTSKAGLDYANIDDSVSGTLKIYFPEQSSAVTVYLKIEGY